MNDTGQAGHLDGGDQVRAYLRDLEDQFESAPSRPLQFDWPGILPPPEEDAVSASLVVNWLLGSLTEARLRLRLPNEETAWAAAVRSGLPFALANRVGDTLIEPASADIWLTGLAWKRSWTPGTRSAWTGLLGESPAGLGEALSAWTHDGNGGERTANGNGHDEVTGLYGPRHAIFVNPHRARRAHGSEHVFQLISLWLSRHLRAAGLEDAHRRDSFLNAVRTWIDELVQNVRGHATSSKGPAVKSFVRVELLSVGDEQRLLLAVQDTGPGIASTARPKLSQADQQMLSDDDLLIEKLLLGQVAPWGRARGIGLPQVVRACHEHEATLSILSGNVRVDVNPGQERPERRIDQLVLPGTAAIATVLLPR